MAWLHRFFAFSTSKRHIASELLAHLDSSNPYSTKTAPGCSPPAGRSLSPHQTALDGLGPPTDAEPA
jgi:hypothetical protein